MTGTSGLSEDCNISDDISARSKFHVTVLGYKKNCCATNKPPDPAIAINQKPLFHLKTFIPSRGPNGIRLNSAS